MARAKRNQSVTLPSELTYTPAWWVPGPHAQTMWGKFMRRGLKVPTRAEHWVTPDDDLIEIRRLDAPAASPAAPRMLILHGLEGTIESHYLRGILDLARERRWPADVLLFRGCNGQVNRARRMYHSGETTDLSFVIDRLIASEPERELVLAGFSLGGNVLLKWLGERGDSVPSHVRAAAAVSVPFDLERGCRHLEHGFAQVYNRHFLRTLKEKALNKLVRFPGLFDESAARRARTLYEFDDAVTAPVHGFVDAHDYYTRSSSIRFLGGISIPTLLLSAYDDPFLPREVLDDVLILSRNHTNITPEFHRKGGHVGFVSGRSPLHPVFYGEHRIVEFLAQHRHSHQLAAQ
jgi:predicted alpha/beta-fold hydrolase